MSLQEAYLRLAWRLDQVWISLVVMDTVFKFWNEGGMDSGT
jgi:hypothetical protein